VTDELRLRLEGALEVLEAEMALLKRLRALATRSWELHASEVLGLIERVRASVSNRDDAVTRAQRVREAEGVLEQLEDARVGLVRRLDRVLSQTSASRVSGLDAKLAVWEELARNVGPLREGAPISEGRGFMRSREWWVTFGAMVAVTALHQPLLMFLLAGLGVVWRDFSLRELVWRLFDDVIELYDGEHTVRIPLSSLESVEQTKDGLRLRALRDVELRSDASLFEFALTLMRVQAEQQARARFKDRPAPALWLHATLQQEDIRVEGCVVVCDAGFVFLPEREFEGAWKAVIGAPRLVRGEVLESLRSLPAALIAERFQPVRELGGTIQLDGYGESAWQPLGDVVLVALEAERKLFVRCSPSTQERLRLLRETLR
jgi:hypothetical protein